MTNPDPLQTKWPGIGTTIPASLKMAATFARTHQAAGAFDQPDQGHSILAAETGQVSIHLCSTVDSVAMVDTSEGMLDVLTPLKLANKRHR